MAMRILRLFPVKLEAARAARFRDAPGRVARILACTFAGHEPEELMRGDYDQLGKIAITQCTRCRLAEVTREAPDLRAFGL